MAESETKTGSWMMTYFIVYFAILILMITTFSLSFIHHQLGPGLHLLLALIIATVQAFLLSYFLMHLKEGDAFTWLVVGAAIFWLIILFVFLLTDYLTRDMAAL